MPAREQWDRAIGCEKGSLGYVAHSGFVGQLLKSLDLAAFINHL
jgi:hypothetical protein